MHDDGDGDDPQDHAGDADESGTHHAITWSPRQRGKGPFGESLLLRSAVLPPFGWLPQNIDGYEVLTTRVPRAINRFAATSVCGAFDVTNR